jgi:hypothetical protein
MNTTTHPAYTAGRQIGRQSFHRGLGLDEAVSEAIAFVGEAASEDDIVRIETLAGASTGWHLARLTEGV